MLARSGFPPNKESGLLESGSQPEAGSGRQTSFSQFRILRDTIGYSGSAVFAQALGLVAGFWIARLLGPADFGVWNAVSLVLAYGAYVEFGVLSAMGRDLPYYLGQRNTEHALRLEGGARWATIAGAILAAGFVFGASFLPSLANHAPIMRTGLRVMAVALILQQIYTYHRTVLRANNLFGELSRQQFVSSIVNSGLSVLGVVILGLYGRMMFLVLAQALIMVYAIFRNPWRRIPAVDARTMWQLFKTGVPITLAGSILSLVTTVDRPIVLAYLGEKQLGYFGLALLLTSMVSLVPGMASQVLYPRMTHLFGQSGRDVGALRALVLKPPLVLACLLPVVIGPVYLVLPVVIRLLLPDYTPAILATQIVVVGIFFSSILGVTDYFLVTTGKLKEYAFFGGCALILNVAFDYVALRLGFGIVGVAFCGTPLTYFVYSSAIIGYALSHYTRDKRAWGKYFSRLWLPFAYMLGSLCCVGFVARWWNPEATAMGAIASMGGQVAVYLVGMVPLVVMAARELGVELSLASLTRTIQGR